MMTLFYVRIFASIFGTVVKVKQICTYDSLERKKYIGVWWWRFEQ